MSSTRNIRATPKPSFLTSIRWYLTIRIIKLGVILQKFILNNFKPHKPSYKKTYAALPSIRNLIFLPPTWKTGDAPLPLLIDVHGGGFTIGAPEIDNFDNHTLASYGICVVAIGYRLAPGNKFPDQVYDVATLIDAVLNDPDLPVDKSRVAIAGYSAGGNLALAAPQLNNLHSRIKGVVAYYPTTDVGRKMSKRLETAIAPPGRQDILISLSPIFHWAYFPQEVDLNDPLLAPIRAERNKLPEKVFIMGCEWDMLCTEAEEAAEVYAKAEKGDASRLELGNGRVGWTQGNVTWEKLLAVEHGFNQRMGMEKGEKKKEWLAKTLDMHKNVAEWLFRQVYA